MYYLYLPVVFDLLAELGSNGAGLLDGVGGPDTGGVILPWDGIGLFGFPDCNAETRWSLGESPVDGEGVLCGLGCCL